MWANKYLVFLNISGEDYLFEMHDSNCIASWLRKLLLLPLYFYIRFQTWHLLLDTVFAMFSAYFVPPFIYVKEYSLFIKAMGETYGMDCAMFLFRL